MYGQKKNFSTFSYKLVQISPIMILVNSGAFLSISGWFCELTELIFVMISAGHRHFCLYGFLLHDWSRQNQNKEIWPRGTGST